MSHITQGCANLAWRCHEGLRVEVSRVVDQPRHALAFGEGNYGPSFTCMVSRSTS